MIVTQCHLSVQQMVIHHPVSPGQKITMLFPVGSTSMVEKVEETTHALLIMALGVQTAWLFLSPLKVSFNEQRCKCCSRYILEMPVSLYLYLNNVISSNE